jgi:hypothetical protein
MENDSGLGIYKIGIQLKSISSLKMQNDVVESIVLRFCWFSWPLVYCIIMVAGKTTLIYFYLYGDRSLD